MVLVLVFVGSTIWPYPVWSIELPPRRCIGRPISQEVIWQENASMALIRKHPFKRAGRCGR
jgi:hypothetical protein